MTGIYELNNKYVFIVCNKSYYSYLDEKSIMFGRTGIWPDTSNIAGNEFADPSGSTTNLVTSSQQRINTKPTPKYGLLSGNGETLRSLSPAEQVIISTLWV